MQNYEKQSEKGSNLIEMGREKHYLFLIEGQDFHKTHKHMTRNGPPHVSSHWGSYEMAWLMWFE